MIKQLLSMSRSMMQNGLEAMESAGKEQMPRLGNALTQMSKVIHDIDGVPDLVEYSNSVKKMTLGLQKVMDGHSNMVAGYKLAIEAVDEIMMFVESTEAEETGVSN